MKINNISLATAVCVALIFSGCRRDPNPEIPTKKNRTVLNYMVADNNLYKYAEQNINDMESVWSADFDGHIVVFLYPVPRSSRYVPSYYASKGVQYNDNPRLLLIEHDNDENRVTSRVLKTYTRDLDPCNPDQMKLVTIDAMSLAPADNFGLVMWSHGDGWIPKGAGQPLKSVDSPQFDDIAAFGNSKVSPSRFDPEATTARAALSTNAAAPSDRSATEYSIGISDSHDSRLEIDAMARVLSDMEFDFILFDACHMAGIEVAYELRNITRYVISSAAETLATGFPYKHIVSKMVAPEADVVGMARAFFEYYNDKSGDERSATISVVKCDKLPALAAATADLCKVYSAGNIISARQQYGRSIVSFRNTFYDLEDVVRTTWPYQDLSAFEQAISAAVIYKAATPWLFNTIEVVTHCGLSCYIPRTSQPIALSAYRTRFAWSTDSGMGTLVP